MVQNSNLYKDDGTIGPGGADDLPSRAQGRISSDKSTTISFENSKVLDAKGNLLTVYHGTISEFDAFDDHLAHAPITAGWEQSICDPKAKPTCLMAG